MKLSREKVLHLSHLILGHLDRDDGVEYFDEPQEIRQTIVKIIMDEMKNDEAIVSLVKTSTKFLSPTPTFQPCASGLPFGSTK